MALRRSLSDDREAVSEIVGALLLVLIVATAAIGFGRFYLAQQEATQHAQALETDRAAERLEVRAIRPVDVGPVGDWDELGFTLVNAGPNPVRVHAILLNGLMVRTAVVDPGPGQRILTFDPGDTDPSKLRSLDLASLQQATLRIDDVTAATSFFAPHDPILASQAVVLGLRTERGNLVEQGFLPPTATLFLRQEGAPTAYILDGSLAAASGMAFLTAWTWTVTLDPNDPGTGGPACSGAAPVVCTYKGRLALAGDILNGDEAPAASYTYTVQLTVRDSFGMTGQSSFTWTA